MAYGVDGRNVYKCNSFGGGEGIPRLHTLTTVDNKMLLYFGTDE